ncbi:hypothetical protein WJW27_002692 [Escherichia coli]|uniref:hypothetical protein n=1 Tax=Escherichia coli TaxID=562 RepID=UPI0023773DC2|nr:hypothetical protein vBEcoMphAPEC6_02275 [Escherichia phage ph0011]
MSLEKLIISEFRKYIMDCDRDIQRKFNEYLDKYPYLMFNPFETQTDVKLGFYIGFTQRILQQYEMKQAEVWVETDSNETNVFYLYSYYAEIVSSMTLEGYLFVKTSDIEKIYIEPVSLDMVAQLPTIQQMDANELTYSVFEYLNRDDLTQEIENMVASYTSTLISNGSLRIELIYDDTSTNAVRGTRIGKVTIRVVHNDVVLGYISKRGHDLCMINAYVIDRKEWNDLMQKIVDGSGIRDIMSNETVIINPDIDCDVYFPVPGFTLRNFGKLKDTK